MLSLVIGTLLGGLVALWVNIITGRLARFDDIIADLAHAVFTLRRTIDSAPIDSTSPRSVWISFSGIAESVFQPVYFRLELEKQRHAKRAVGKLMQDVIDAAFKECESVEKMVLERQPMERHPSDVAFSSIGYHFETERDAYVARVLAIKPSIVHLALPKSWSGKEQSR